MLLLLLQTRVRFYLNFIRWHFTRRVLIELGFLSLFGLYLAVRSPADIGYRIDALFTGAYSPTGLQTRITWLWLFYLVSEIIAWFTLRPTADHDLLVSLPVPTKTLVGYYLLRYFLKMALLILLASSPFLAGTQSGLFRMTAFCLVVVVLFIIGLAAFAQAEKIRQRRGFPGRWLLVEIITLGLLVAVPEIFKHIPTINLLLWLVLALLSAVFFFQQIVKKFHPASVVNAGETSHWFSQKTLWHFARAQTLACGMNDFYFLLRKKRSIFWLLALETLVVSASIFSQTKLAAALISSVFIQLFFSWLFILNLMLALFERDAQSMEIFRHLPLAARQIWLGRWLLVTLFCSAPLVLPLGLVLVKFPFTWQMPVFFSAILLLIPAVLATIFCNTGFALFPQANLAGYTMNFSILLVILFWFYLPFGSLFILGMMLIWIRKSQQHFQWVEIS